MFSGYSVGGVLAALLAIRFLPDHGFRPLFALGLLPLVTVVPLAWRFLPESRQFRAPTRGGPCAAGTDPGAVHRPEAEGQPSVPGWPASAACCSCTG